MDYISLENASYALLLTLDLADEEVVGLIKKIKENKIFKDYIKVIGLNYSQVESSEYCKIVYWVLDGKAKSIPYSPSLMVLKKNISQEIQENLWSNKRLYDGFMIGNQEAILIKLDE